MLAVFRSLALTLSCAFAAFAAQAQSGSQEVTVSYRERIALPPPARLHIQLLDLTPTEAPAAPLASQLFAMSGIPMTVSLTYDPALMDAERKYAIIAGIWSGDEQVFRTVRPYSLLDGNADRPVEIVLSMVEGTDDATAPVRKITGVRWAATEVLGAPWPNDESATLAVDETMTFSIFGGCNQFTGDIQIAAGRVSFPENFAGTLMACPNEVEEQERRFLAALSRVSGYIRYGNGLVLMDDMGNALLHFEERPE